MPRPAPPLCPTPHTTHRTWPRPATLQTLTAHPSPHTPYREPSTPRPPTCRKGKGKLYGGKIDKLQHNGLVAVSYDDGDYEAEVPGSRLVVG